MTLQTQAQIYLADQRGLSQTPTFRSFHTLNFGTYTAEGREPVGPLCLLNDETLQAGASLTMQVDQPTQVLLLPLLGGLDVTVDGSVTMLAAGQTGTVSLAAGMSYTISNPYEMEPINYVQAWFTEPDTTFAPIVDLTDFDLTVPNRLVSLFGDSATSTGTYRGYIGRFGGRAEGTYPADATLAGETRQLFAFVVQGVFELANRLLHERDSLALPLAPGDKFEFEALSNDALLLLFDVPV